MYRLFGKRLLDIFVSLVILVILSPIILLSIGLVIIADGFPVFYRQKRIGQNGSIFYVWKLRTMKSNTDHLGTTSYENDPRYFCGSKFLRSLKLDELPQLVNIFKGRMSLVGPRPTVIEDYNKMSNIQKQRFNVKPGLTGLAQISGNTSLLWPERIKLDIQYCQSITLFSDLNILLLTAVKWVFNKLDSNPPEGGEW